jgi:uncharacterized repeat protein (TIGR03803 family)
MSKLNWVVKTCGVFLLWAAAAVGLPAQTFTSLYSFDGTDGNGPFAGLIQGTDGNLYGTTEAGGTQNDGTVFSITPSGTLKLLYSFCSLSECADGNKPYAGLVQATNGDLYGTTWVGGSNSACPLNSGCGTVFKITSSGKLTTLHSFGYTDDGANPYAGLVQGTNGTFYGTNVGGANGYGTVFSITPSGTLTTLHSFCPNPEEGCADGASPYGGLVQATNGDFYGTTYDGGASNDGTVFKITPSGTLTTLYDFCTLGGECADGEFPYSSLVHGADGDFFGTTVYGGTGQGPNGTIFKITPSGKLTTLYSFCSLSNCADGETPYAGLVQGTDGNFYGTASQGGANGDICINGNPHSCGTVFKITPSGAMSTLHSFDGTDGWSPYAGVFQATNGTFYGTTEYGGAVDNSGTVFSLSVGLVPFVETLPISGKVGATVKILGTDLTGATSVTFNGTSQPTFTVVSASEITTSIPTGATTGTVQVVTPTSGTLSSNVPFTVRQ